jgi:hypothetical protein
MTWAANPAIYLALGLGLTVPVPAVAQEAATPVLRPFSKATTDAVPAPWRLVGLAKGKAPLAQFEVATLGYDRVLKLATDKSYATAVHELPNIVLNPGSTLKWRWRLEQPISAADLHVKKGDDVALKVCAMFDMPLNRLGLVESGILRMARAVNGEKLPSATLCYVWDHQLPVGTELPNAFTKRLRYLVLDSGEKQLGQWVSHERDIVADFLRMFGHEADVMPPVIAVAVGADSDNTQSSSLGYVGDVVLMPAPKP